MLSGMFVHRAFHNWIAGRVYATNTQSCSRCSVILRLINTHDEEKRSVKGTISLPPQLLLNLEEVITCYFIESFHMSNVIKIQINSTVFRLCIVYCNTYVKWQL